MILAYRNRFAQLSLNSSKTQKVNLLLNVGELAHVPVDEKHLVPNERRIPRVTTAMWKFESVSLCCCVFVCVCASVRVRVCVCVCVCLQRALTLSPFHVAVRRSLGQ